jgi:hypothetical protein
LAGPQDLAAFNKTDLETWIVNYNEFMNAGGESIMSQLRPKSNETNATAANETANATAGNETANATATNATEANLG